MRSLRFFLIVFFIFNLVLPATFAAVSEFKVDQLIFGTDLFPPTIPANVLAVPASDTQIDVSWDASTDNVAVAGYQVFRDAGQIATTTLTTYSDTGLTASTTYSYTIRAFDAVPLYSTTSAASATTTLPTVATTTPTTTPARVILASGSGSSNIVLTDLVITPNIYSLDVSFLTNIYTKSFIRWGRTDSFEGGYIESETFKKDHKTLITGLQPGTVYEVEIVVTSRNGRKSHTENITISTLQGPDVTPPDNVSNLRAIRINNRVALSWDNPVDDDFSRVRILSSDVFYPTDPADGWFVYEGNAESFIDVRAQNDARARYYTVFTYDDNGNISSGSIVRVVFLLGADPTIDVPTTTIIPTSTEVVQDIDLFQLLKFKQYDKEVATKNRNPMLDRDTSTVISIPYNSLPENLKTIIVHLEHPDDTNLTFSFLLQVNADKTAYEARIGSLVSLGIYEVRVELFDFKINRISVSDGKIEVVKASLERIIIRTSTTKLDFIFDNLLLLIILAILLLFVFYRIVTHRPDNRVYR